MDKELRGELIRGLLRARFGYRPLTKAIPRRPSAKRAHYSPFQKTGDPRKGLIPKWIFVPDKAKPRTPLRTLRKARKSPLMRLAELYPVRLPRSHD